MDISCVIAIMYLYMSCVIYYTTHNAPLFAQIKKNVCTTILLKKENNCIGYNKMVLDTMPMCLTPVKDFYKACIGLLIALKCLS